MSDLCKSSTIQRKKKPISHLVSSQKTTPPQTIAGHLFLAFDICTCSNEPLPCEQCVKVLFLLLDISTPKGKTWINFLGSKGCMDVKNANPWFQRAPRNKSTGRDGEKELLRLRHFPLAS